MIPVILQNVKIDDSKLYLIYKNVNSELGGISFVKTDCFGRNTNQGRLYNVSENWITGGRMAKKKPWTITCIFESQKEEVQQRIKELIARKNQK